MECPLLDALRTFHVSLWALTTLTKQLVADSPLRDTRQNPIALHTGRLSKSSYGATAPSEQSDSGIGRCMAFAKQPSHDLWLPDFWDEGYYDHRYRQQSPFAPLVWAPETHSPGIDEGDEIAALGPGGRPRLGVNLTKSLELVNEPNGSDWRTADGSLALRSQVWGSWKPDPDSRYRHHEDGEILWAAPEWLAAILSTLNRRLVFTVTLQKYRSSRDYDPSGGVKSVLFGLRVVAIINWPEVILKAFVAPTKFE